MISETVYDYIEIALQDARNENTKALQDIANEPTPKELRAKAHRYELIAAGVAGGLAGIILTLTTLLLLDISGTTFVF